ncbi:hypothetical protein ABH926_010184 [Catenulispora sp. GP43]|uniref:hypothetical protein n=1 Tax=Catenulispora sp. GP43 TaxID=3156263 RepID=UPI00351241FB
MVGVLTGLVAVLTVLTVFNLVLLFAVIRRLRSAEAGHGAAQLTLPQVGAPIGTFMAGATDDTVLSGEQLADDFVVAFVSPTCAPCKTQLADFRATPRSAPERTVFFVNGSADDAQSAEFATSLADLGRVAFASVGDAASTAFGGVDSFPTLLRTGGGKIEATGRTWDAILAPAGAAV